MSVFEQAIEDQRKFSKYYRKTMNLRDILVSFINQDKETRLLSEVR